MKRRQATSVFNLSFLDVMSCGFGAVALVFLLISHAASLTSDELNEELSTRSESAYNQLAESSAAILDARQGLAIAEQTLTDHENRLATLVQQALNLDEQLLELQLGIEEKKQQHTTTEANVETLRERRQRVEAEQNQENTREAPRSRQQQYLSGLQVNGKRTLILLDTSSSMLDNTLINIIRRRNLDDNLKKQSPKWQRALRAVNRLIKLLPEDSDFQVYGFNTTSTALLPETHGAWISLADTEKVTRIIEATADLVPEGGTSLINALLTIKNLTPPPDSIVLIVDGLPTQGKTPSRAHKVSGRQRQALFNEAVRVLPGGIPISVILFPMEGDPAAAAGFWNLVVASNGYFISPATDWP